MIPALLKPQVLHERVGAESSGHPRHTSLSVPDVFDESIVLADLEIAVDIMGSRAAPSWIECGDLRSFFRAGVFPVNGLGDAAIGV
ncbi:MAG: hypothetical protein L0Z50_42250, partial [Verrucomicrobiales bacterium]|nr:hypothetical protein [Verrucomicrobiales bacterium]